MSHLRLKVAPALQKKNSHLQPRFYFPVACPTPSHTADWPMLEHLTRRHKKAFLSDQRREIEENNRMRKNRDLVKKIRDTKGTFHAKISTIKDRNRMDLTEAEGGGTNTQ